MHEEQLKKGFKISLKFFTQNMDKEYYIGILNEKLSELESMKLIIGSYSLIMIQSINQSLQ